MTSDNWTRNMVSGMEGVRESDFDRDVWCLLGLPVDNVTVSSTKKFLRDRAKSNGTVVWSTVNVNWLVLAMKDEEFYSAIIDSDIVTLDGRPLLWLARLLGYPMTEIVAGSSLIQELNEETDAEERALSIFFLGGEEGAGELAMQQVERMQGGLHAVGFLNPGFGTVENMSSDAIIEKINGTQPDILLVALGARKGLGWIAHNRHRLNAKVVSHLGATINFLAGTVKRAPVFVRKIGLEWAWRVFQEPKLFRRYLADGIVLFTYLVNRQLLYIKYLLLQRRYSAGDVSHHVRQEVSLKEVKVFLGKNVQLAKSDNIPKVFAELAQMNKKIIFDFNDTEYVDGAFMGLLLVFRNRIIRKGLEISMINMKKDIRGLFRLNNFPFVD